MLRLLTDSGPKIIRCDDYYIRELASGMDEAIFTISVWDPLYPELVEEARIQDADGKLYLIKQIDGGSNSAKIIARIDLDDWEAEMHLAYGNGIKTVYQTVEAVAPPGWTVIDQSGSTIRRTVHGNMTALEICQECEDTYFVYFRWDTAAKTCTIISRIPPAPVGAFATRDLNLKQINYKGKSNSIRTRIYAYGQDNMTFADINGGLPYVDDNRYTDKILPMYWKDERYTIPENLLHDAREKLAAVAVPQRSYDCAVVDLRAVDPEKYGFLDFSLFTVATLIDDIKNFAVDYQVVERHVYPYYPEKNDVIFDTSPPKITNLVDNTKDLLETRVTADQMQTEVDRATGVLQTGKSGYVVLGRNSDGYANEIYFLDRPSLEDAVKVLRINQAGIGFSSTGVSGPYYQSWTLDGYLSLGGVNNAYGTLQILDPSGKLICSVSKDGYTIYDSDGSTVIGQWSHAGISLRKGTIDFNWGTDTIGFYADGTKVQLGDWVIDSQSYGRGIIQSVDEKTGMSADTGDEDLLYLWAGYNDSDDYVFVVNGSDAYVMHDGQAYPIGESIANLNAAVAAYVRDIESGDDDDGDEEGDGTSGDGEDYGGGYLYDDLVINDLEENP